MGLFYYDIEKITQYHHQRIVKIYDVFMLTNDT